MFHFLFNIRVKYPKLFTENIGVLCRKTRHVPSRGFTLVEALVSISIFLLVITSTMFVTTRGILFTKRAQHQVVAFYLAQEALEVIKNQRDNNALLNAPWLTGLGDCAGISAPCTVDIRSGGVPIVASCGGTCLPLRKDAQGVYNHDPSGTVTPFTRSARITETVSDREAVVEVVVDWQERTESFSYTTQTEMYNWQP